MKPVMKLDLDGKPDSDVKKVKNRSSLFRRRKIELHKVAGKTHTSFDSSEDDDDDFVPNTFKLKQTKVSEPEEVKPEEVRPTIVPDPSVVKDLKERREHAQFEEQLKDIDEPPPMDDTYLGVEYDKRFTDGRLALTPNEQRVQEILKRQEIEQALSDVQSSESDLDESITFDQIYEDTISKHVPGFKSTTWYPKPKFHKIQPVSDVEKTIDSQLQQLQAVSKANKKIIDIIESQIMGLDQEKAVLVNRLRHFEN